MNLDHIELGRVAIMQREPLKYIERRIEEAEIVDNRHYGVTVTQQFTVPFYDEAEKREVPFNRYMVIPLGWFVKDRLPDIEVSDENGSSLPFLRRRDQGKVGAGLFMSRWRPIFFAEIPQDAESEVLFFWKTIQASVERVVTSSSEGAQSIMYDLITFLREQSVNHGNPPAIRCFLLSILAMDEFWRSLKTLAKVRLLFTQMKGHPGRTYVITIKYTEMLPRRLFLTRDQRQQYVRENPWYSSRRIVRRILGLLGVSSIGVVRRAINLGQAASFWAIFSVPEGVEPVRCFWRRAIASVSPQDVVSVDRKKAAAGRHHRQGQIVLPDVLALDLQVEPSSAILGAAVLSALLYLVAIYVYKRMPQLIHEQRLYGPHNTYSDGLIGIGTILAAVPAALAGALAYRGHTFVRWASRGPRTMLALLAAQGALLAVVLSLHGPGSFATVLSFILSVYSLGVTGVFLWIRFGTRWRKSERSRLPRRTKPSSPFRCRKMQAWEAFGCLILWIFVVVVVARGQSVLQAAHVFGSKFPGNVWSAWWSWF